MTKSRVRFHENAAQKHGSCWGEMWQCSTSPRWFLAQFHPPANTHAANTLRIKKSWKSHLCLVAGALCWRESLLSGRQETFQQFDTWNNSGNPAINHTGLYHRDQQSRLICRKHLHESAEATFNITSNRFGSMKNFQSWLKTWSSGIWSEVSLNPTTHSYSPLDATPLHAQIVVYLT